MWRRRRSIRALYLLGAALFVALAAQPLFDGDSLSLKQIAMLAVAAAILVALPVELYRERLVLETEELVFVGWRVRRLTLREIVDARCVAGRGLVFVCEDGAEEPFAALGNTAWGHRRKRPTRSDLLARTVLAAAARARGDVPIPNYRLAPMFGRRRAAIEAGIIGVIVAFFLGG